MRPPEEEDAVRRILTHHGAAADRALVDSLSALIDWVVAKELSQSRLARGPEPMPMLSFLSTQGIYGGEAIK